VDPFGFLHPCVDSPPVGHLLRDDVSVVRSPQALEAVNSCPGCWYCFRGEADSTLTFRGYVEKVGLAASIYLRNARHANGASHRNGSQNRVFDMIGRVGRQIHGS
jgi:hypothetical protein